MEKEQKRALIGRFVQVASLILIVTSVGGLYVVYRIYLLLDNLAGPLH